MAGASILTIDFEASSLPAPGSYPIEVAIVSVSDTTLRSWLIRPDPRWTAFGFWDPTAARLHGLTHETLEREGMPAATVAIELAATVAESTVVSDAPGADAFWSQVLYATVGTKPAFDIIDLRSAVYEMTGLYGVVARDAIEDATELARRRFPEAHRAGPDARRTAEVLRILGRFPGS